ncbi:hypothetical protein Pan97_30170 [Bremerella volcania]|uniref:Uncharacterized protein n=1 Tax=Bremerella volcania TaxID=2527984 RepID=A0A518C9R6_9BACT|nr:hypothetical protein Pan97_30170 [Bremerella volcania]
MVSGLVVVVAVSIPATAIVCLIEQWWVPIFITMYYGVMDMTYRIPRLSREE